jgi:fibronectin type 3 domain-containing protein
MKNHARRLTLALSVALLAGLGSGLGILAAQAQTLPAAVPLAVPATPDDVELHANADSSITIDWAPSPGATSYRIYRGTAAGGEGTTPVATVTAPPYTDKNLSPTPVYFYQITAVNASGESARTAEDASKTPPPLSTGGSVAGTPVGNGMVYYCKDARLAGFDWFQTLTGWFPQVLGSGGALSPGGRVVDMAYAKAGTMTFNNVVVPTAGLYTVDWRYAFQGGLFPAVKNRQMGLSVNGTVITSTQSFPITGSFDVYQDSSLQVHLNAGVNSVTQFAVSDHGLSRVDELIVTPATASVPSGPTGLTATAGSGSATLRWTGSTSGSPTSYKVYRGTNSDGEAVAAVGTTSGTTTTLTDTGLHNGMTYFYFVQAFNGVGGSPNSNEVSVVPAVSGGGGGPNLALHQPTTASSVENAGSAAANATDGSATTRWSSAFSDPQWIQVDLGATHTVSQVVIQWETAHATAYQVQVSADAATWTSVYSTTTGPGGTETLNVTGTGRFIRIYGTARNTGYGYSIWELQVLGT